MPFDECMDDDSTARKMDKSFVFVKYFCNGGPNMFLLFRGYPVEFNHRRWLYCTMSRPFSMIEVCGGNPIKCPFAIFPMPMAPRHHQIKCCQFLSSKAGFSPS